MDMIPCETPASELSATQPAPATAARAYRAPRPEAAEAEEARAPQSLKVKIPSVYIFSVPDRGLFDQPVS